MITRTKVLLGLGVAGLVIGLILSSDLVLKPPIAAGLYVILPLGAIFFGFFLLSKLLEKESVFYDEEHEAAVRAAEKDVQQGKTSAPPSDPK